jgi:hypothetical protein
VCGDGFCPFPAGQAPPPHHQTINWARLLDVFLSCDRVAARNASTVVPFLDRDCFTRVKQDGRSFDPTLCQRRI